MITFHGDVYKTCCIPSNHFRRYVWNWDLQYVRWQIMCKWCIGNRRYSTKIQLQLSVLSTSYKPIIPFLYYCLYSWCVHIFVIVDTCLWKYLFCITVFETNDGIVFLIPRSVCIFLNFFFGIIICSLWSSVVLLWSKVAERLFTTAKP